ncbi:MAG: glycosyltransferase family 2 protein [Phycisphaerales bacterium]|jgi:dolichol-phosphate mannosyltransferase|nr:glycosyltransferase family 2 protein [Phycisphaerales bacterium]
MSTTPSILVGIPVYNEEATVAAVLDEVRHYAPRILVVDDGSTDETPRLLASQPVDVVRHPTNRGYGRAMQEMLQRADHDGFDWLITMDCDKQHEPAAIPEFVSLIGRDDSDVISGSRYLSMSDADDVPPLERRSINVAMTSILNDKLGLSITDAFCGFKAYRCAACRDLTLDVDGYDFPMQFWVQAVHHGLRISETPVRLIYNDPNRSFGGPLDDPDNRRAVYERTLRRELIRCGSRDALCRV